MSKSIAADRVVWAGASRLHTSSALAQERVRVTGLSKAQAEELLDWLEANGYRDYHLAYSAGKAFTVSYANGSNAH